MLRKTKLYLDKTIKVESAESTSHTGNGSYKELSVFNRALGKGGGSGLRSAAEPAPGKPGIVLPLPVPRLGGARALAAKCALLSAAPAALEAISHGQELHWCSSVAGSFPLHLHTARGGLQYTSTASQPILFQSVFCFSFSAGVALVLTPGVHLTLGNTSPRGLVRLSVFAYYKTFGPVSSVMKVRSPPAREYRSSWLLAQLIAERSMPVLAQAADPMSGADRWLSLCLRGPGAVGLPVPHPLLCFPHAPQEWGGIAAGGLLEGVRELCGAHLATA